VIARFSKSINECAVVEPFTQIFVYDPVLFIRVKQCSVHFDHRSNTRDFGGADWIFAKCHFSLGIFNIGNSFHSVNHS